MIRICEVNQITNLVSGGALQHRLFCLYSDIHESIIAHLENVRVGYPPLVYNTLGEVL